MKWRAARERMDVSGKGKERMRGGLEIHSFTIHRLYPQIEQLCYLPNIINENVCVKMLTLGDITN